jgi:hypothetical protein
MLYLPQQSAKRSYVPELLQIVLQRLHQGISILFLTLTEMAYRTEVTVPTLPHISQSQLTSKLPFRRRGHRSNRHLISKVDESQGSLRGA